MWEREDLELLHYALLSVPCVNDSRLREALLEVQEAFPFALEQIHVDDYKDKEALERSFRRNEECKVYKAAGTVLKDLFYEALTRKMSVFPARTVWRCQEMRWLTLACTGHHRQMGFCCIR